MFGAVDTQPINHRVEVLRRNMSFRLLTMMSLEHMCGGFILSVVVMLLMVMVVVTPFTEPLFLLFPLPQQFFVYLNNFDCRDSLIADQVSEMNYV